MAEPSKYSWTEPESDYKAKYPYNTVTQSESGHIFEMDDTPGAERIRIQHRKGTYTEVQADGTRVDKIVGDGYEIVSQDKNVLIKGICNITIEGDAVMQIKGDSYQRVKGNFYQEIEGNYEQVVKGEYRQTTGKDISINIGGETGTLFITAAGAVDINADLDVDGAISGESIMSRNEVTAGTGIHAGLVGSANPFAGISTLGGIASGFPKASGPGMITATTSVSAPLISGVIVTDIKGPMELIRQLYDIHIHPAPRGMTGTPVPLM